MHPLVSIFINGKEIKDAKYRLVSIETRKDGLIISLITAEPEAEKPVELAEVWR